MMRSRIDFIHDTERPSRLASLFLLGAGSILLCTAALLSWQQHRVDESSARLKERQAIIAHQQGERERDQALAASQLSYLQDKRWKAALRELNTPWFAVLGAIEESAVPPAYILATRLDPERGSLELELIAPQFDDALQLVEYLQTQPGLTQPRLVTREAPQQGSTVTDNRFVIHAAWEGPAHAK